MALDFNEIRKKNNITTTKNNLASKIDFNSIREKNGITPSVNPVVSTLQNASVIQTANDVKTPTLTYEQIQQMSNMPSYQEHLKVLHNNDYTRVLSDEEKKNTNLFDNSVYSKGDPKTQSILKLQNFAKQNGLELVNSPDSDANLRNLYEQSSKLDKDKQEELLKYLRTYYTVENEQLKNENYIGNRLMKGVISSISGGIDAVNGLISKSIADRNKLLNTALGNNEKQEDETKIAKDLLKYNILGTTAEQMAREQAKMEQVQNVGATESFVGDVAEGISGMIPTVLISVYTQNPDLALTMMSTSAGGNAYRQAINEGANNNNALAYGTLMAIKEYTTEKMFGAANKLAGFDVKGYGDELAESIINRIFKENGNKILRGFTEFILGGVEEGLEEFFGDLVEPYIKNLTLGTKEKANLKEALYNGLVGGITGLATSTPGTVINLASNSKQKHDLRNEKYNVRDTNLKTTPQNNTNFAKTTPINENISQNNVQNAPDFEKTVQNVPQIQEETVGTNIGNIPIAEYRDIMAQQAGFNDYADMRRQGYKLGNKYDVEVQEAQVDRRPTLDLRKIAQNYIEEGNISEQDKQILRETIDSATDAEIDGDLLHGLRNTIKEQEEKNMMYKEERQTEYHVSKNISKDIDNILNNINERNPVKLRDYTPSILVQNGIKDLPMYENPSHIRNNILTESEARELGLRISSKDHYHGLGKDTYIKAIESLDDPRVVLKYKNDPNQYIILTVVKDNQGNNIIVPIQVETDTYVNKIKVDINRVKSVYGYDRTNPDLNKYIKDSIKNNNLEKIYEKKKPSTSKTSQSASTNIIPTSQNYVNNQQENIMPSTEQLKAQDLKQGEEAYNTLNMEQQESGFKEAIEDIANNPNANKVSYTNDFYRNMRNALGEKAGKELTGQFDSRKLNHVKTRQKFSNELKSYVVDELGIKLGSEMSADVQKYGEKLITEADLKRKYPNTWQNIVKADKWFREKYDELIDLINETRKEIYPNVEEKIQETKDALFKTYDLIKQAEETQIAPYKIDQDIQENIKRLDERIAAKQEKIKEIEDKNRPNYENTKTYTNLVEQLELLEDNKKELERLIGKRYDEKVAKLKKRAQRLSETLNGEELWRGKRIPKRENYYRHFQEMTEGFKALHNIFTTPAEISSQLAGTSEYTKPKSKFLGLAQKRTTNETQYDAVGGFLNYLEPASYAINIDPFITELREISQSIKNNTQKSENANKLTEYLDDFANNLAGKTNPFDRGVQKLVGRKAMKALDWTANRIKSNAVLGNINSSISQVLNLPQVVGKIKDPIKLAQGVGDLLFRNGKYQDSQFIQERYHNDIMSQFKTKLTQQPKKFATWMLGALDEGVTKAGWNAVYRQAIQNGIENPVQYADDTMRSLVAGRGLGERTLAQESKLVNLTMPFTVEVGNYWRVMKDFVDEKDFGGILITFIVSWLLNRGIEAIGASGKTFDLIDAIYDAITEEDLTLLERFGRVGGEILSSIPGGQQIASIYPEYGADFGIFELPSREKLFGSNDPTRFGTGNILSNTFSPAIPGTPIPSIALPWGGTQLKRTVEGAKALLEGGDYKTTTAGEKQLKFPINMEDLSPTQKFLKSAQVLTLGKYSVPEADYYFENGGLSKVQTEGLEKAKDLDISIKEFYDIMEKIKDIDVPTRKNKEGKEEAIPGARKKMIIDELNKTDLNNEQKKLMYDIFYSRELN